MGYHRNPLLYSNEGGGKASKPGHIKKIILVTPEGKSVCHAHVIMAIRYQGRKLGLDISIISTYYYSNVIGCHSNALLPDEGG